MILNLLHKFSKVLLSKFPTKNNNIPTKTNNAIFFLVNTSSLSIFKYKYTNNIGIKSDNVSEYIIGVY